MAQNDITNTAMPVQFVRSAGGETYQLVGNRIQIEDALGNLLNLAAGLPVNSPDMLEQLALIVERLSGTLITTISGLPLQPTTFVPLAALDVSAEATIWDPAAGKKFRLMGGLISVTGAAGNVVLKDGNSGATIFNVPNAVVGTALAFNLGDGILSAVANNNLRAVGAALQIMNGTIWGQEVDP